jgi:hypothetical protein
MSVCHGKQDQVHPVTDIVDYFTNVSKISDPLSVPLWSLGLP